MDSGYLHLPTEIEADERQAEEDEQQQQQQQHQQHEPESDHQGSHDNVIDYWKPSIISQAVVSSSAHIISPRSSCPTCMGKGKLSQSQADSVLALIPAGDKRLKPRRTKLYLTITAVVSFLFSFLLGFFLWPRSILVAVSDMQVCKISA